MTEEQAKFYGIDGMSHEENLRSLGHPLKAIWCCAGVEPPCPHAAFYLVSPALGGQPFPCCTEHLPAWCLPGDGCRPLTGKDPEEWRHTWEEWTALK